MDYEKISQLVARAIEGDQGAFAEIYELLFHSLYYSARKVLHSAEDAADIVQDVMIELYGSLSKLKNSQALVAYANRMVYGKSVDLLRKQRRWSMIEDLNLPEEQEDNEDFLPDTCLETKERREEVARAVDDLNDNLRIIILMYYYQQMSAAEICQTLSLSESAVNARLSRARTVLKGKLMKQSEHEKAIFAMGFIFAEEAAQFISSPARDTVWNGVCEALGLAAGLGVAGAASTASSGAASTGAASGATTAATQGAGLATKILVGLAASAAVVTGGVMIAKQEPPSASLEPPTPSMQEQLPPPTEPPSIIIPEEPEEPEPSAPPEPSEEVAVVAPTQEPEETPPPEPSPIVEPEPSAPPAVIEVPEPEAPPAVVVTPIPDEALVPVETPAPEPKELISPTGTELVSKQISENYTIFWNQMVVASVETVENWTQITAVVAPYVENRFGTPLSIPLELSIEQALPQEAGTYDIQITVHYQLGDKAREETLDLTLTLLE